MSGFNPADSLGNDPSTDWANVDFNELTAPPGLPYYSDPASADTTQQSYTNAGLTDYFALQDPTPFGRWGTINDPPPDTLVQTPINVNATYQSGVKASVETPSQWTGRTDRQRLPVESLVDVIMESYRKSSREMLTTIQDEVRPSPVGSRC